MKEVLARPASLWLGIGDYFARRAPRTAGSEPMPRIAGVMRLPSLHPEITIAARRDLPQQEVLMHAWRLDIRLDLLSWR